MSGTPAACTVLAAELQRLRARHRLSLGALAERTPFSKSSWGRYLNGTSLPPWQAVQHLCALVDEPEDRFRALWNVAEAAWNQRDAVSPAPERPKQHAESGRPQAGPQQPARQQPAHPRDGHPRGGHPRDAQPAAPEQPTAEPAPAPDVASVSDGGQPERLGRRTLRAKLTVAVLLGALVGIVWRGVAADQAPPVAAATSASPHPVGCVGRACDGEDPGTMDCGVFPLSLGVLKLPHGAELEIRYNSQCRAAWARVWTSQVGDRLSISNGSDVKSRVVPDPYTAQTFFYTMMVPLLSHGPALRACLTDTDQQSRCVSAPEPHGGPAMAPAVAPARRTRS